MRIFSLSLLINSFSWTADVKYLQFGREIKLLAESLKRLERIIDNANVQHPRRQWHSQADNVNPNTLREVTGDFLATLSDCQDLLDDNSKFSRTSSDFINNIIWWSSVEREVISLKERVQFHATKVTLIAKPFETQLLLGIRRELQQLRRDFADLKGVVIQSVRRDDEQPTSPVSPTSTIPECLVLRFTDALYRDKPQSFELLGHLPLREAFDALVFNFSHSTVEFNPRPELGLNIPEEPQYLNLLKSRWLVSCIEDSYHFRAAGPDSLWADYLRELKDDIRDQFRGFETGHLMAPSYEVLLRLPDSCFSVWVIEESPVRPLDLAEQRPFEEKILELGLPSSYGSRQSALTVFRKSDAELRLVSTTKDERNTLFHREEGMDINMNLTKLIPAYVNPEQSSKPTLNVLLCANEAQNPKWYTFKGLGDVKRFQQALTGYRVFHDMSKITWSIEGSLKPHKFGNGSLQLWHYKPLPSLTSDLGANAADCTSPTVGSPQSPPLGNSRLHRHSTAMTSVTLVSTGSITSSVTGSQGDGTAILRPTAPALVIFTMCERKYTFLHIKCGQNPGLCTPIMIDLTLMQWTRMSPSILTCAHVENPKIPAEESF